MKQSRKPKTNKVLVTNAKQNSWILAEIKNLLSIQFTAQFINEKGKQLPNRKPIKKKNLIW